MAEKIRWGIISTGFIARQFAIALQALPDAEIVAVGSRTQESADRFGVEFHIARRYASYEDLVNDSEVDVVYIGTPHCYHKDNTLLCLNAGKHVICEKPFAINAGEAEEMIECARRKDLFLMEALWTRFFPVMCKLREMLREGVIGQPRILSADFGFYAPFDPKSRLFAPEYGGGALLDVGVYPIMLSSMIFGRPSEITGMAHLGESGVDEQSAVLMKYPQGELAVLHSAIQTITHNEAVISGTKGRIRINPPWWKPSSMTLTIFEKEEQTLELPYEHNGYQYEAAEVMNCIREGRRESEIVTWDESLQIMRTLDRIRDQWGLKYPMECENAG